MKTKSIFKLKPLAVYIAIAASAGLTGCGGGSDSSSTGTSNQQVQLSGLVAKGIIKNALVSAYGDQDKDGQYDSSPLTQTSTDANGDYSLDLPVGYTGPINIQITKGINGKMVCDITNGCKGGAVSFGEEYDLPQGFLLEAVDNISSDSNTSKPVSVTSLTHMAAKYAKSKGANAEAVQAANEKVSKLVGVSNLTGTRPINITDSNALKNADSNARKLSVLSAALAKDAMTSADGDISGALDDWANEFTANDGGLVANVSDTDLASGSLSLEKLLKDAKAESDAVVAKAIELEKAVKLANTSLTDAEKAAIEAEMAALKAELDTAVNADSADFNTSITEAEKQTEGEIEAPVTGSTPVLSSAAEVKAFVDEVRTWATLLTEQQQSALANEEMVFSEEADTVMNSLDAGGLLADYYSQYMNLFDGFTFGDKVDVALPALSNDFDNFSLAIAALDTALVNAVDSAANDSSGSASATIGATNTSITLTFTKDAAGKATLTNLPQTISDGAGNSLVIRSGSVLIDEDATTGDLNNLAVVFDVTFTGANGSSLAGNLNLRGTPEEGGLLGLSSDSTAIFTGELALKDAGAAKLVAEVSTKGISISNLDYNYSGTDGSLSFNGAGTQLNLVGVWDISKEWDYQYSQDDGSSWQSSGGYSDEHNEISVKGTLKGSLNMSHNGNTLEMALDSGLLDEVIDARYGEMMTRIAVRNANINVTNSSGNTLALTATHSTDDDSLTFIHNAVSYTDSVTNSGLSLTSASIKTNSEDLSWFLNGLDNGWTERLPVQIDIQGLKLSSTAQNLEGVDNNYQFSGSLSAKLMLESYEASDPYMWCDPYNPNYCEYRYDTYSDVEPTPAAVSISGRFDNLTRGSFIQAQASFTAPNGAAAMDNSLWWQVQEEGIAMGSVTVAADGQSFTTALWNGTYNDVNGNNAAPAEPVTVTGTLVTGGIKLETETWEDLYGPWNNGDGTLSREVESGSLTQTLTCSDDSSLENCAKTVAGVSGLNYTLTGSRALAEVFTYGHSRLNAFDSETPESNRIRYQVRHAEKQTDGTYKLTGQKRLRATMSNNKFYSNMAASVSFEPQFNSLPETAKITLTGSMSNLSGYADLLSEQTDTSGAVTQPASTGLVSAILQYGDRELWLSTKLRAEEETVSETYTYWDGTQYVTDTDTYTDQFLEPQSGFIKITNATGTSIKISPAEDDLGILTGQLRAADGGLWGTIYQAESGQLMVAYKNGAVEALTLANSSELIQPDAIEESTTDPDFCELNPTDDSCADESLTDSITDELPDQSVIEEELAALAEAL